MTYSIVARDPATGDLGVAVQTCMFAVGSMVPWARAGVGVVASQAIADPAYGPNCLAGAYAATGEPDRARDELKALIAARPSWETIVRSFAAKGLVAAPAGVTIDDLLA